VRFGHGWIKALCEDWSIEHVTEAISNPTVAGRQRAPPQRTVSGRASYAPLYDMVSSNSKNQAERKYRHLLHLHERLLSDLQGAREELSAPGTSALVKEIKALTGSPPDRAPVMTVVEEAIRALKMSESDIHGAIVEVRESGLKIDGVTNMPAYFRRFLAERPSQLGFSCDVSQDEERGWVVRWKEYTHRGTVHGFGQLYERPYAWLKD